MATVLVSVRAEKLRELGLDKATDQRRQDLLTEVTRLTERRVVAS